MNWKDMHDKVLKDIGEADNDQVRSDNPSQIEKGELVSTAENLWERLPSTQERSLVFTYLEVLDICRFDSIMSKSNKELWRDALIHTHSPALSRVSYSEADDFKALKWSLDRQIVLENIKLKIHVDAGPDLTQAVKQFDWLVRNNQSRIAIFLLQSGFVDPNRTMGGSSLLHLACAQGLEDVVECLIGLGAKLDRKVTKSGATPLHLASQSGHKDVMKVLVQSGIDVNRLDKTKSTALHLACAAGHIEAALYLIQQAAADIDIPNNDEATPIFVASGSASCGVSATAVMIVQTLVQAGADVNRCTKDGSTPLSAASLVGDFEAVECLIEGGADVNKVDKNGFSPLYLACQEGHLRCVQILLREGAQFERPSADGGTCLGVAAQNGHTSTVEALIAAGAEVDKTNQSSNLSPLHLACLGGHAPAVEVLLASGAAINLRGGKEGLLPRGRVTPLGCALEVKSNAVVTLLRAKGAHT